ncbi:hypothetical protein GCM10009569_07730 [Arthrobacter russicus]|uniref:hypothetical protein n=1 Tax=Arthrobacter russicus TaxID=172040 RepID=UPI00338C4BBA
MPSANSGCCTAAAEAVPVAGELGVGVASAGSGFWLGVLLGSPVGVALGGAVASAELLGGVLLVGVLLLDGVLLGAISEGADGEAWLLDCVASGWAGGASVIAKAVSGRPVKTRAVSVAAAAKRRRKWWVLFTVGNVAHSPNRG